MDESSDRQHTTDHMAMKNDALIKMQDDFKLVLEGISMSSCHNPDPSVICILVMFKHSKQKNLTL